MQDAKGNLRQSCVTAHMINVGTNTPDASIRSIYSSSLLDAQFSAGLNEKKVSTTKRQDCCTCVRLKVLVEASPKYFVALGVATNPVLKNTESALCAKSTKYRTSL